MPYTVFLSHSVQREDYGLVVSIANLLWQEGIEVFVPEWFPRYPEAVNRNVASQIAASDLVLAVVTSASSRPSYMYQELGFARSQNKSTLAIVERGINAEGFLHDTQSFEFSRDDLPEAIVTIGEVIKGHRSVHSKQQKQKTVASLVLGGLFLWWLSRQGRPRQDDEP